MDYDRRALISSGLATSATLLLSGCDLWRRRHPPVVLSPYCPVPGAAHAPPGPANLIDAHCHLFNVKDLPAAKFVRIVFLEAYDEQPELREKAVLGPVPDRFSTEDLRDPTLLDRFIAFCIIGLAAGAPTAQDEIDRLSGRVLIVDESTTSLEASEAFVAAALSQKLRVPLNDPTGGDPELQQAILKAAGEPEGLAGALPADISINIGARAFRSDTDLGVFVRWISTLRMYRADLARELAAEDRSSGSEPLLFTPAMVDYNLWLGQSPVSPLPLQVEAMGLVARQPELTPVHGYVSFDPLRAVVLKRGRIPDPDDGLWDPLDLVREATERHGFLGVKLYPPMGFRASRNNARINTSSAVWRLIGDDPERPDRLRFANDLNAALEALYVHCEAAGVPIMAHGGAGNAASEWAGLRADPTYWVPVFEAHPTLHVMLAHFGVFGFRGGQLEGKESETVPFDQTWEAVFGRYVEANPESFAFADISYRANIFKPAKRARCAAGVRDYVARYDPNVRHLIYGSDWVMLGIEKSYSGYARHVGEFLANDCCLPPEAVERVMFGNAMRFLGLGPGEKSRRRLEAFWAQAGLPANRIPLPQAL